MPFDSITTRTKYAAFAILLVVNLLSISSLFHSYPWLRTLGLLMGLLSSIAILLVTLTPVNDKPNTNDSKEIKEIIRQYNKTYQECESKIIAKVTENILIIKSILILENNPIYKKRKLIEFYNEAHNEIEKELILYAMSILNQDLKLS